MNFFCAKPINDIIYNQYKTLPVIDTKYSIYYSDDTQYMRRMYHYYTESGKKEIFNRIQLLSDFYSSIRAVTYEYPLMILTNTKKIFVTRIRRLRKMKASDGSSDESEIENEEKEQFESEGFLKSFNSASSSLEIESIFESVKDRESFDEDVHDVYAVDLRSSLKLDSKMEIVEIEKQEDLDHLICDFHDIDAQATIRNYQQLVSMGYQNENKAPLKKYMDNQIFENKTHFTQNNNNDYRRKNKYVDLLKRMQDSTNAVSPRMLEINDIQAPRKRGQMASLLAHGINFEKERELRRGILSYNKQKNNTDNFQLLYGRNESVFNQTRQQNQSRKQKIRDKAAQLLNRVTSSNYLQSENSSRG